MTGRGAVMASICVRATGLRHGVVAHVADGCLHAVMLVVLVPMLAGEVTASVAAGLSLVALAMALSPFSRASHRVRAHVIDLLTMGVVTVVGCMQPPSGQAGMAMPMAGAEGVRAAALVAVAWAVTRTTLAVRDRRHRGWSALTGILTGGCLAVMLVG